MCALLRSPSRRYATKPGDLCINLWVKGHPPIEIYDVIASNNDGTGSLTADRSATYPRVSNRLGWSDRQTFAVQPLFSLANNVNQTDRRSAARRLYSKHRIAAKHHHRALLTKYRLAFETAYSKMT